LVGDAAHTIHPLAGQGLNLGLADVQTLADCLATRQRWEAASAPRLMRRYERQRRADTQALQWATHGLFHLFTNDLTRQTPMAWLRNTGLSAFNALPSLKRWAQQQAMGN
jgi:2-polyprenyl-6-methoxyphenol hydroxylase-like FAD-dependent oxidoreductase